MNELDEVLEIRMSELEAKLNTLQVRLDSYQSLIKQQHELLTLLINKETK